MLFPRKRWTVVLLNIEHSKLELLKTFSQWGSADEGAVLVGLLWDILLQLKHCFLET